MIKFALYAVSMFWVEVTYDAKDNKITGIKSFVGGETLDKYSNVPMEKVSELLGHSSMKITQDYYGKIVQKRVSEEMERISRKISFV